MAKKTTTKKKTTKKASEPKVDPAAEPETRVIEKPKVAEPKGEILAEAGDATRPVRVEHGQAFTYEVDGSFTGAVQIESSGDGWQTRRPELTLGESASGKLSNFDRAMSTRSFRIRMLKGTEGKVRALIALAE